jgi:cell division protein FtsQ
MSAKAASRPRSAKPKGKAPARGRGTPAPPSPLGELVRRASVWIFVAMLAALALAALLVMRLPQRVGSMLGEAAGQAGFSLKHVEIKGAAHVPQLEIYNIAFDQASAALPLVDLEATRQRLLKYGWVRDARVSRRFPDTLVVDIVERRPAAIWQNEGRLALIDDEGVVLAPVRLEAMPDLPLVIGADANRHSVELATLLAAAPRLKPVLAGASWIGARRWDLRFHTGEVLALPEGDAESRRALARFAQMDQQKQLLGKGFVRFDMRIPGRFVIRVSSEPGSSVPSIAPDAPPADAVPAAPSAPATPPPQRPAPVARPKHGSVPDAAKTI